MNVLKMSNLNFSNYLFEPRWLFNVNVCSFDDLLYRDINHAQSI